MAKRAVHRIFAVVCLSILQQPKDQVSSFSVQSPLHQSNKRRGLPTTTTTTATTPLVLFQASADDDSNGEAADAQRELKEEEEDSLEDVENASSSSSPNLESMLPLVQNKEGVRSSYSDNDISVEAQQQQQYCYEADFVALGLGGANMMCMLFSLAMGKRCVGVELRGDPFLSIHWNIRVDFYHQLGLIDELMLERYGEDGIPKRLNGKPFRLAECWYSKDTCAGFVVADEVIDGHDTLHHICGTIQHIEFMDDRHVDGKPDRTVTVLPPPPVPSQPDPTKIRTNIREVLDGPSTFQCEATNLLILLRRYLEAVQEMDTKGNTAKETPRVRLFTSHQVKDVVKDEQGRVESVHIEKVQELDYKGKFVRIPEPGGNVIAIDKPELVVIAQGVNAMDAKRLFGFVKKDVVVDHHNGQGPRVAQADYLAGFIDILVDGRLRRRIASAFDENGHEFWVRQIAVGHENDPQVGWLLVQVPDFMSFNPIQAGLVPEGTDRDSVEYFAALERMLYDFYIQEGSKILEIDEETLRTVRMAYGPKLFSLVEQVGDNPRVAPNVVVAGDSFGNGHFLTSGGAMTGMVGHSMAVLNFWKALMDDEDGDDETREEAFSQMAKVIQENTHDWLAESAKEFSSFAPVNFGADRVQQVAANTKKVSQLQGRVELIDASVRQRHELQVQNPSSWRRPAFRNGRVYTAGLKPFVEQEQEHAQPNGAGISQSASTTA